MASSTGRQRSVGGSTCSAASRYSTRSRARVRLSCAATAPAVLPSSAASEAVSCPETSCASSVSPPRPHHPARHPPPPRRAPPGPVLAEQPPLVRCLGRPQVDDPVLVPALPVLVAPHRGDDVARGHD